MSPRTNSRHGRTSASAEETRPAPELDPRVFADIVESGTTAVGILALPDLVWLYVNARGRDLLGAEDPVGGTIAETSPELAERLAPVFAQAASEERLVVVPDLQYPSALSDASRGPVYYTFGISPLSVPGVPAALLFRAQDTTVTVTSRLALGEAALKAQSEASELETVFETLVDPVVVLDADALVVHANPAAVEALGFDPTGRTRANMAEVVDYRDGEGRPIPQHALPVVRALRGERVENLLLQMRRGDGARRRMLISAATFSAEGRLLGVAVTFHDVTEREELLAELRESIALGEALNRINARIDSDLAFDAIMAAVVGYSAQALGAGRAALALPEHGRWVGRYLYGAPPGTESVPIPESERPYIEEVARSEVPVVITDVRHDRRLESDAALRGPVGAVVAMRIEHRGEFAGVLRYVFAPGPPFVLGRAREDFLRKLAAVVSLGLENARLLAAERHVSETLQTALLAVPHAVHGVTCGTLYRSASSALRVGGDFYDLFDLQEGRVAVVIGDVSGKGLEAAAATALVRNTIRAYAQEGHGPSALLRMTNAVVLGATPTECFVTVFFGVLDTQTGELVYCSAGHPRPMVKRRDGSAEVLETRSAVVGAFEEASFVDDRARLDAGDVLLLYTDGVTEAHCRGGGLLGEERLAEFLGGMKVTRAGKLPETVFRFVLECTGGTLSDDLAMLSVALGEEESA